MLSCNPNHGVNHMGFDLRQVNLFTGCLNVDFVYLNGAPLALEALFPTASSFSAANVQSITFAASIYTLLQQTRNKVPVCRREILIFEFLLGRSLFRSNQILLIRAGGLKKLPAVLNFPIGLVAKWRQCLRMRIFTSTWRQFHWMI